MLKIFNSLIGVNIQNYEGGFKLYVKWSEYLFTAVGVLSVPTEDVSNQYPIKKNEIIMSVSWICKISFQLESGNFSIFRNVFHLYSLGDHLQMI